MYINGYSNNKKLSEVFNSLYHPAVALESIHGWMRFDLSAAIAEF